MEKTKISLSKCDSYHLKSVQNAVNNCLENIGGLSSFIKPGNSVLIKPNMLQAKAPEEALTTHPAVIEAIINAVRDVGGIPMVGDSPGASIHDLKDFWETTGYAEVCRRLKVELVNFEKSGVYLRERNGKKYYIAKPVLDCDLIINVPKIKTHGLTIFTCAVKNMYGVIPGIKKTEYHSTAPRPSDFAEIVVDIYALSQPQLNIVDGVVGMDGNGPSAGNPKQLGMILASEDGVALDSFICHILGKKPSKIPINQIAHEQNLGETIIDNINVLGEIPTITDFKWPSGLSTSLDMIPAPLARSLMKLFWSRPAIDPEKCIKCGNCIKSCPVDALTSGVYIPEFDYGECISCLCCMEMCPEKAVYLDKSLIFRILSRSD